LLIENYKKVQTIAKRVQEKLFELITPESTEIELCKLAQELLSNYGASSTWDYDVPALVLLGSRSCLSVSGRDYRPSVEKAGDTNLVTVDLSPSINNIWGDCARSFYIENGKCVSVPIAFNPLIDK
jgi:Xaa-Pro aminopeptidase